MEQTARQEHKPFSLLLSLLNQAPPPCLLATLSMHTITACLVGWLGSVWARAMISLVPGSTITAPTDGCVERKVVYQARALVLSNAKHKSSSINRERSRNRQVYDSGTMYMYPPKPLKCVNPPLRWDPCQKIFRCLFLQHHRGYIYKREIYHCNPLNERTPFRYTGDKFWFSDTPP